MLEAAEQALLEEAIQKVEHAIKTHRDAIASHRNAVAVAHETNGVGEEAAKKAALARVTKSENDLKGALEEALMAVRGQRGGTRHKQKKRHNATKKRKGKTAKKMKKGKKSRH